MLEKSPLSKVDQIGVIVRDLDEATKYFQSLGIGPFEPLPNLVYKDRRVLGEPIALDAIKLKVKVAWIGPVQLELIQPVEGKSLWSEFLKTRGEGINHLGFFVDDIDEGIAWMVNKGLKILYSSRFQNGGGAAYFDTGRVLFELIDLRPKSAHSSRAATNSQIDVLAEAGVSRVKSNMGSNTERKLFSTVDHVGVIVKGLDEATEYYESLGVGSFEPVRVIATKRLSRGKFISPESVMVKAKIARTSGVKFELLQPVEGELWNHFLKTKGEGINHVAFSIDDLDAGEAELEKKGVNPLYQARFANEGGDDYFDTGKIGGVLLSLIKWPQE